MENIGNNTKVSLPSGAELEITLAPFSEGERLFSATAECLKGVKVDGNADIQDITSNLNGIKDMFLSCLTSQAMKDAILACLKRCTYNKQRITSWDVFDDVKAREDYLAVCWEVVKFNLTPFTRSLFSKFSGLIKETQTSQK
ncbi:MAG: hypothetical protein J6S67_25245 [Methanobrevibacter sp.]|nr:hypothetical protein [Methanobrevibacter sp.]